jgi:hypothetical protein
MGNLKLPPRVAAYVNIATLAMEADDTDEQAADQLRDLLDSLWRWMTPEETELCRRQRYDTEEQTQS